MTFSHFKKNPRLKIIFQCKRYKKTVSREKIGDFRNAVIGRAEKGIIITTGAFSEDAKREANRDGAIPIELIDGERIVELFEELELGVKPVTKYEIDEPFPKLHEGGKTGKRRGDRKNERNLIRLEL